MMIKVRGWHTNRKKMFSAEQMGKDQLTLSVDGRGFINVHGGSQQFSTFITDMIPMQWVGIKDKNDKDVYMSDICRYKDDGDRTQIGVVKDHGYYAGYIHALNSDDEGNYDIPIHNDYEIEVLGNVWENPELLKETNDTKI